MFLGVSSSTHSSDWQADTHDSEEEEVSDSTKARGGRGGEASAGEEEQRIGGGGGEGGEGEERRHGRLHGGATVKFVGLSNSTELNGKYGTVIMPQAVQAGGRKDSAGRVCVRVGKRQVLVRPGNLQIL